MVFVCVVGYIKATILRTQFKDRPMDAQVETQNILNDIIATIEDKKGLDIVTLDLKDKGAFVDYMIIVTGRSTRQVSTLVESVSKSLKSIGVKSTIEGSASEWALVDVGDIIVHIFTPDARAFYDLESIWNGSESGPESE